MTAPVITTAMIIAAQVADKTTRPYGDTSRLVSGDQIRRLLTGAAPLIAAASQPCPPG